MSLYGKFNESEDQIPGQFNSTGVNFNDAVLTNLINASKTTDIKPPNVLGDIDMVINDNSENSDKKRYGRKNARNSQSVGPPPPAPNMQQFQYSQMGQPPGVAAPTNAFEIVHGKYYVSVDHLLASKKDVVAQCERLVMNPQPLQPQPQRPVPSSIFYNPQVPSAMSNYQNMAPMNENSDSQSFQIEKRTRKENAFRWTPERHLRFAIVCMALGVKDCKPKHIMTFYEGLGIDRAVISSHLQKLRNNIIKQYGLSGLDQVQNTMMPKDMDDPRLATVCKHWGEEGFTGFTSQQVLQLVQGMN